VLEDEGLVHVDESRERAHAVHAIALRHLHFVALREQLLMLSTCDVAAGVPACSM
jgi:hypothetical protein